jgi:hypothetical protein
LADKFAGNVTHEMEIFRVGRGGIVPPSWRRNSPVAPKNTSALEWESLIVVSFWRLFAGGLLQVAAESEAHRG